MSELMILWPLCHHRSLGPCTSTCSLPYYVMHPTFPFVAKTRGQWSMHACTWTVSLGDHQTLFAHTPWISTDSPMNGSICDHCPNELSQLPQSHSVGGIRWRWFLEKQDHQSATHCMEHVRALCKCTPYLLLNVIGLQLLWCHLPACISASDHL